MNNFDGLALDDLTIRKYSQVGNFHRFFDMRGKGFTKINNFQCNDDDSLRPIKVDLNTEVFIKRER